MPQPQLSQTLNLEEIEVESGHDENVVQASKHTFAGLKLKQKKIGNSTKNSDTDSELETTEEEYRVSANVI